MSSGIHLVHKPAGPTSFSLVRDMHLAALRQGPPARKICHGGTLDPFASGLLLMLVEPATRLFEYLHQVPKVYRATVQWGVETDNGDPFGKVTFNGDTSRLSERQLQDALAGQIGWHEQTPHATSAERIDGERAYVKAHRGEAVTMPACRVYLHEARWVRHELPACSDLRMVVRGGYYVRALARDLGRLAGCGAHVSALVREAIGPWGDPGEGRSVELHGREILPWARSRVLTDTEVGQIRRGQVLTIGELAPADWRVPERFPEPEAVVRAFHGGKLRFLLREEEGRLNLVTALRGGL